jgi:hypothetical protein
MSFNPIAEAEVYLAYGRQEQALEILQDSLLKAKQNELSQGMIIDVVKKILSIASSFYPSSFMQITGDIRRDVFAADESLKGRVDEIVNSFVLNQDFKSETKETTADMILEKLKPKSDLKKVMSTRLITIGTQCQLPGFGGNLESTQRLRKQFEEMDDQLFMTFFELIIIQAHKDGHQ